MGKIPSSPQIGLGWRSVKGPLRRHPRPVPFHGLRPPLTPLTLQLISAEIVLFYFAELL